MFVNKEIFKEKVDKLCSKIPSKILYFDINNLKKLAYEKGHDYIDKILFKEIESVLNKEGKLSTNTSMDEFVVITDFNSDIQEIMLRIIGILRKEGLTGTFVEMTRTQKNFHWDRVFELLDRTLYEAKIQKINYVKIEFI
jgi:GGDEF domain-containing protein